MKLSTSSFAGLVLAAIALVASPVSAKAQGEASGSCQWGCQCTGRSCGCNSYGSGKDCSLGGNGCVVTMCDNEQISMLVIAPDGSLVPLPARYAAERVPDGAGKDEESIRTITGRWEFVASGRSVARNCSGVVTTRYYDRAVAADIRKKDQNISI